MSSQDRIKLKIPTARAKLQSSFPQDPRGDIKIILNKKYVYKLQKAFLRLQSNYFKKVFGPQISVLQVCDDFQESHFENVLKCFYGFTIQVDRSVVLSYFKIIKYLQIQCLLKFLREDMIKNIHDYQIFILLRLGHEYNQQQIFEACFRQLEAESFQPLKYQIFQLLKSSQELFKLIIKTHNRMKAETQKGLPYSEIDKIIKDFCSQKKLSQSQYQQMKFQLIDKNSLSSVEYKEIFMDQLKNMKKSNIVSQSFIKSSSNNYGFQNSGGLNSLVKTSNLTESMISQQPIKNVSTDLALQMENTFEKKLNQQLKAQNQNLKRQIEALKQISEKNQSNNITLQNAVAKLQQSINSKDQEDKKQKQLISRMEKAIITMKNQLTQKSNIVQKLQEKITKLQKSTNKKYMIDSDEEQEQNTIQSQIVPAHFLNQMMPTVQKQEQPNQVFKKKPPPTMQIQNVQPQKQQQQEELDDEDLEQMYAPRLQFTQQPIGTPKKYFPALATFITDQEGWNKKKLTLIYRRSQLGKSFGQSSDLRNRKSLLILIKTQYGQYIGGFTSISLPKATSGDYLQDPQAFLFSLSRNQKFQILKSQASQAIFISESNLISFGNDLTIAENCLKQKSESSWPSSYNEGKKNSRLEWFIGGQSPFLIAQIECYQVEQAEMEMVL